MIIPFDGACYSSSSFKRCHRVSVEKKLFTVRHTVCVPANVSHLIKTPTIAGSHRANEIGGFGAGGARNRVNAICPGGIATEIFSPRFPAGMPADLIERAPEEIVAPWLAAGIPLGRAGFPADIANAALWLASSESSFVTGHALVVDGGATSGVSWSRRHQGYEALRERCVVDSDFGRGAFFETSPSRVDQTVAAY
jgi:hypothetical protein